MSDSGRSTPSAEITGNGNVQTTPEVESPTTADVPTEPISYPYKFNVDQLKQEDKDWFSKKIKIFAAIDETDEPGEAAGPSHQPPPQIPTDAFGLFDFEGEDQRGALPSWYIRLAHDTTEDILLDLLETKLVVMSRKSFPIRIHCIDYNKAPNDFYNSGGTVPDVKDVTTRLRKDLESICRKTAGIILTWSGQREDNLMHQALKEMMTKATIATNLASITTPLWQDLDSEVKHSLQNAKGNPLSLPRPASAEQASPDPPQETRAKLGTEISQYASHFFFLDMEQLTETQGQIDRAIRHFQNEMIKAMDTSESKKKEMKSPVVCLLINGHHDALKMVEFALNKRIPVIIVKGSGGYADVIAEVYFSAVHKTIKYRDESGQFRAKITKKAGGTGRNLMQSDKYRHPSLRQIFDKLDLITVYVPASSVQTLDSVVFEALLKHKHENQIVELMEDMQRIKKSHPEDRSELTGFFESDEVQMDYFIEALKQNCVGVVKTFLDRADFMDKLKHHFHMGRVLRLYSQHYQEHEKLIHFRGEFADLFETLPVLPLRCVGKGCPNCDVSTNIESTVSELVVQRTCLHPIQELFLWALHDRLMEMAIIFWERCEDKIAAALVAWRVFKQRAKKSRDPDIKWQMKENVRQFQDLAIQTLGSCHKMDETKTELLLTKPCSWWGNNSVLQLAIMTENKEFMAQTACTNIMTLIWKGDPLSDPEMPRSPCQLVDTNASSTACTVQWSCSPRFLYAFNFIMQLLFLGLFSYRLLFDEGQGLTWVFIVLIVCVTAITVEEIRQLVSKHAVLRDRSLKMSCITHILTYLRQGWNWIDIATILLFWFGMIASLVQSEVWGRFLLSLDIFFFFMRTFQMLMIFKELGLMLVMVYKMVKDTINFMIILLIFVLAYAVASESLLYPRSNFTVDRLFQLPRKAYWQVFGELNLEEIEIREMDSCSGNRSKHYGYDEPHCPTKSGTYLVPVLLGIHVMITNVLLLNLLIARFGVTFNKVHEDARQHQSWQQCQIIMEYYSRTVLPPPLNILHFVLSLVGRCCLWVKGCVCRRCCCCKRQGRNCRSHRGEEEDMPLLSKGSLKAWRSADRQSVDITWTNRLTLAGTGQQEAENDQLRQYTVKVVEIINDNDQHIGSSPPAEYEFSVVRIRSEEEKNQAYTVWDLDPQKDFTVSVAGHKVAVEQVEAMRTPENLLKIMAFENEQAEYVCHQDDPSKSWLKDLQAQTKELQQEIDKVAGELKENHGSLKEDISNAVVKLKDRLKFYSEKHNNKNDTYMENIKDNLAKLSKFIQEDVDKMKAKMVKRKEDKKEAMAMKEEAEKELQQAQEQLSQLRSEKEAMAREMVDMAKAFEERQQELEHSVRQTLREGQEEVTRRIQEQQEAMMQALQQQVHRQEALHREQQEAMMQALQQQVQQVLTQVGVRAGHPAPDDEGGDHGHRQ
ncbi:transient receptor potential cation channel subfamily M member-like 2 isoform X2 [Babylonia areolata]